MDRLSLATVIASGLFSEQYINKKPEGIARFAWDVVEALEKEEKKRTQQLFEKRKKDKVSENLRLKSSVKYNYLVAI